MAIGKSQRCFVTHLPPKHLAKPPGEFISPSCLWGVGGTKACHGQVLSSLGVFVLLFTACLDGGTAPGTEPLTHRSCLSLGRCLHQVSNISGQWGLEAAWGALTNPAKSQGLKPLLRPVLLQTAPLFPFSCCNRSRAAWVLATGRAELWPGPWQQQDLLISRWYIGFTS